MKKLIPILLLVGSTMLTGCGDSNDFDQVSGQQVTTGPVIPNPPPPPPPVTQGFFVDAATGNDATGSFATGSPFATVQAAVAAAPEGETIRVRPGNYTGLVALKNGQRLVGAGSVLAQGTGEARPTLTGPVDLADGNTLDFLRIAGTNGDAVVGSGQNGGTVTNCEIANAAGGFASGIVAEPGTGTWIITGNTISGTAGLGVVLQTNGAGEMTARVNDNTITGNALSAIGFTASGSSELVAQVHRNTMTGNQDNFTFEAIAGDTAVMCLDIEDNANDDVYVFSVVDAGATLNVEQLGQLQQINQSGAVVIDAGPSFFPPRDVADGFCGF
jgi:hypothetical protein